MVCFNCNTLGHIASRYPQRGGIGLRRLAEGDIPTTTGRVFNLSKMDALTDPQVIEGTLLVQDTYMQALMDLGATHSFISYAAVECTKLNTKEACVPMNV